MANNVTLHQKNKDGAYDNIYPRTTADHTMLTPATGNKYGLTDGNAEQAVSISMDFISMIGAISIYVFDPLGDPVEGAIINGISGNRVTNNNGFAQGTLISNPITVKSPYVDLKDKSVDASGYVGTVTPVRVTLDSVVENSVIRYTTSTSVKFTKAVKSIDVCCVGGGGGGGTTPHSNGNPNPTGGAGGGGGGIVNKYNIPVSSGYSQYIKIGSGGKGGYTVGGQKIYGEAGGTTSFMGVSAKGGEGGYLNTFNDYVLAGQPGVDGCGYGGSGNHGGSNTTISEFDDGKTFYSGGGGAGIFETTQTGNRFKGGSPNGADGGVTISPMTIIPPSVAGIGGGGGGASNVPPNYTGGSGGSGLVAIRIHLS